MVKTRRSHDRLIFNMGIPYLGKTGYRYWSKYSIESVVYKFRLRKSSAECTHSAHSINMSHITDRLFIYSITVRYKTGRDLISPADSQSFQLLLDIENIDPQSRVPFQ